MEYHATPTAFSGHKTMILNRGDDFWEVITASIRSMTFSKADVATSLRNEYGYTQRTATLYASALVDNCVAMPEGGMVKIGPRRYRWFGPDDYANN